VIAISYRREDTLPVAGRLYDRLEQRFGKQNVFMDFDSIRPGFDFRDQIRDTIERSKVVIVVIGPGWLGKKSDGTRRIDDPADFVRLEVACALQREIPVIPVLVNNTPMPNPETLPSDMQALAFRHALPLDSGLDFRQHADRLINGISDTIGLSSGLPGVTGVPKRKSWLVFAAIGLALAIGATVVVSMIWPKNRSLKPELPFANSPISGRTASTANQSLPPLPAARFAGAWAGQMKIGTENYDITLTVNADATSLLQQSKRGGQPAQQHPHPTTINGETLVWIGGDSGNVGWRFTPNADGQTASATTSMAGMENTATFTRLRENSAGNSEARLSASQTATVSPLPTTPSNAPLPLDIVGQGLKRVTVKKYNCAVLVPNALFPNAEERFGDGNTDRIQSVNGCSTVALRTDHDPLKRVYEKCITQFSSGADPKTIDYKVLKDSWFVVSGDSKTTGYYTKGVRRRSDVLVLELQYDGAACNIPDDMLTEMSRKFDGALIEVIRNTPP